MHGNEKLQAFTAFGQILGDQAYPFQMSVTFIPFRRNVAYAQIVRDCPLDIARQHGEWKQYASLLRYGHFEISADFFNWIARYMLRQPENGRLGLGLAGLGFVGAFGFQAALGLRLGCRVQLQSPCLRLFLWQIG